MGKQGEVLPGSRKGNILITVVIARSYRQTVLFTLQSINLYMNISQTSALEQAGGITRKERSTFGLFDSQYNTVFANKYLLCKILM